MLDSLLNLLSARSIFGYCRRGFPLVLRLGHDGVNRSIEYRRRFDKLDATVYQFRCKGAHRHVAYLVTLAVDENEITGHITFPGH